MKLFTAVNFWASLLDITFAGLVTSYGGSQDAEGSSNEIHYKAVKLAQGPHGYQPIQIEFAQGLRYDGGHNLYYASGHGIALSSEDTEHEGDDAQLQAGLGIDLAGSELGHYIGQSINLADVNFHSTESIQKSLFPTKTIKVTKPVAVPVLNKYGHPVGLPVSHILKVPVPQPYAVHIPVPKPVIVPIYKLVPKEIVKKVPISVEKLVPVYVPKPYKIEIEKHYPVHIAKPYAVHVPVYKHIYHHVPKYSRDYGGNGAKH